MIHCLFLEGVMNFIKRVAIPFVLIAWILSACSTPAEQPVSAGEPTAGAAQASEDIASQPVATDTPSTGPAEGAMPAAVTATTAPLADPVPLELVDQGYSLTGDEIVNYSFRVRNPNPAHMIQYSTFKTFFYDANGAELGTDEGTIELVLPGQTTGIGSARWMDNGGATTSMKIELTSGTPVVLTETLPPYEIGNTSECVVNGFPVVRAEVTSPYATNVILPRLSVVYYDADGKISGGGYGYRAGILANGKTGVVISAGKSASAIRYEVFAGYRDLPGPSAAPADASPLQVNGQAFVQDGSRFIYSVMIENPNAAYLVNQSMLAVNAYAADGTFLSGEPLMLTNVLPGQKLGVSRELSLCEGDVVDHIEVAVSSGDFTPSQQTAYFTSENVSLQGGTVSGDLINQLGQEIKIVYATAIVYDANDQIIGGGSQTLDSIAANGRVTVQIPVVFNGTPARAELYGVLTRKSLPN
jgi:hypothetical protein